MPEVHTGITTPRPPGVRVVENLFFLVSAKQF
mgnify:CR=1 FL=1